MRRIPKLSPKGKDTNHIMESFIHRKTSSKSKRHLVVISQIIVVVHKCTKLVHRSKNSNNCLLVLMVVSLASKVGLIISYKIVL